MFVPKVNEKLLEDLEVMGLPKAQATRALHYSGTLIHYINKLRYVDWKLCVVFNFNVLELKYVILFLTKRQMLEGIPELHQSKTLLKLMYNGVLCKFTSGLFLQEKN